MCRPRVVKSDCAFLESRRLHHPVLAGRMSGSFIPNDVALGSEAQNNSAAEHPKVMIFTGPNMSGKSTVLRMTCVAAIMAHMGCY
eukprot:CAMPEP_0185852230 /NCGR_PEP_ID=MMETSP1354-20130828/13828_1 /TAXON_ID=708628 /ORGANISM="Erythrolobus madagascarensis, Strain CCMP3276" /LENGTH=84 /DNA_ID=CAMNT_0028553421 /DNA_START=1 /DNA_END=252 /DNA_ORIENTATION=-